MVFEVRFTSVDIDDPMFGRVCLVCGAFVHDLKVHKAWHEKVGF